MCTNSNNNNHHHPPLLQAQGTCTELAIARSSGLKVPGGVPCS